ncbi:helix-turn-helix domain-containing protein [Lysinibacillus fusiformis]|uniref:Cro/C1-type HTH DNA-binding domain-containing protein n=1 Tax=Lysinibacillus fusiformis TaxID=28031 RepID=A0A1H9AY31_9BACI|nr:helix-turn-helix transcriptional regulator [Lysinibacillus fusiformis]SCX81806.1 Cro/C1-type HTH DNA-binding domain-containing protein [Lysinibacillus fusiformis]SEM76407.1 Cro/C1-type HTH DNA-binding domain-containing protein [Lysinibacillus fusiformis]SEP81343.1 Cro/C1-type HTH DNA-binding domain-containing protein [Lysinibacillus fusiformis]
MAKQVVVKIDYLLEKYEIKSLRKLAEMCDIRHAALSELTNGKRKNINFGHIERIAETLGIDDISEIIDFVEVDGEKAQAD